MTDHIKQKVLLVIISTQKEDLSSTVEEFTLLADSANAEVFDVITQNLSSINIATAVGSGKLDEIAEIVEKNKIDAVIFNNQLTPSQVRNIEKVINCTVLDRTNLILDIFAQRAKSAEGKLQVELAQLKYIMPRLVGSSSHLSNLGAGIGTRGPGETKLETDRRHIRRKIHKLSKDLEELESKRDLQKQRRIKDQIDIIAIVGYTNAGKSTLFNLLTGSETFVEDRLFATLDPTARQIVLPSGKQVLLIDTVGFIRNLPHELVQSFKSTLEITKQARLILNVCDVSDNDFDAHLQATKEILEQLNATAPQIIAFNKRDKTDRSPTVSLPFVSISASENLGIDQLLSLIDEELKKDNDNHIFKFPLSEIKQIGKLRKIAADVLEKYEDDHVIVTAKIKKDMLGEFEKYLNDVV